MYIFKITKAAIQVFIGLMINPPCILLVTCLRLLLVVESNPCALYFEILIGVYSAISLILYIENVDIKLDDE